MRLIQFAEYVAALGSINCLVLVHHFVAALRGQ